MRETDKTNLPARRRSCSRCGRLGHQVRTCTNPPKAHDKIGVEVEGWWRNENWNSVLDEAVNNWHMDHADDGSLTHDDTAETRSHEFKTRPGTLCEATTQVLAIYPDKCDPSAGMHVHMSFTNYLDIGALNSEAFFAYWRQRWEAFGARHDIHRSSDFWSRLRGGNSYCQSPYVISTFGRSGDRYRAINWQSWSSHKTVEFRMLPLFKQARLAALALEETVVIVEDYIAMHAETNFWNRLDRDLAIDATCAELKSERTVDIYIDEAVPEIQEEIDLDHYTSPRTGARLPSCRVVEIEQNLTADEREMAREVIVYEPPQRLPGHRVVFGRDNARRILSDIYGSI